jgi:hypothetical protein
MNTKNAERYETELDDRETVLTGSVFTLPTLSLTVRVGAKTTLPEGIDRASTLIPPTTTPWNTT